MLDVGVGVIRLASRLAVSGGRESVVRLVLTAVGVAIGTTLLLFAAAADPAIRAQQRHQAWHYTSGVSATPGTATPAPPPADAEVRSERGGGPAAPDVDPLLWRLSEDAADGHPMLVLRVAATGPTSEIPLGLPHVPKPGEVYMSPPLATLLRELPADRLADRFPSAPSGMIGQQYLAGPDQLVAVVGMRPSEMRDAVLVQHVNTAPQEFAFSDFLRLMAAVGAIGLILPVLIFVSTSTRLGAARREQRFAALRLAGATPRQTNLVAAVEAAAAAAIGAVVGLLGFLALRSQAARIPLDSHPSFVEDVHVITPVLVAIVVAIPVLAVVAAMVSLRRLQISPLGVARRVPRPQPTVRRLIPLVVGGIGFVFAVAFGSHGRGWAVILPIAVTFSLVIYGIVVAGPWLTVLAARVVGRFGRRPTSLLAGRRLEADPATGFRAVSGLVLAVFVASVFSGTTPAFVAEGGGRIAGLVAPSTLVAPVPDGTSEADAGRAVEAARAAGSGAGIVIHVDPDPPGGGPAGGFSTVLVACRDLPFLGVAERCPDSNAARVEIRPFTKESAGTAALHAVPTMHATADVDRSPAQYVVVKTDGRPATTDRVRTAMERAVPGSEPWVGAEASVRDNSRILQLSRLADLALVLSLVIAGCGLAVAVAGGIIERKRPFALLRLSGMRLAELQRVAMLEAAAPLVLIALASAVLGLGVSAVIVTVAGQIAWRLPTLGYWLSLAGGLSVALGVAAASLPLLGRTTAPSAVRFE
ncbi:MAG: putative rane protein [Actinomycetia bacterium]|nr:putative rane protein [Actinomycetes bacterium]